VIARPPMRAETLSFNFLARPRSGTPMGRSASSVTLPGAELIGCRVPWTNVAPLASSA
jgi:hypothetical protein